VRDVEPPQRSPVQELEERLGTQWPNIDGARARSVESRALLQRELAAAESDDISVVVFGSLARGEFTTRSDVDWTVLVDGLANPAHLDVAQRVGDTLTRLGIKPVGREGIFGNLAFSHSLVHLIGGEDDTNHNTTQRILLLLESAPIGRRDAYDRVIRNVLRRYLEEDGTFTHPEARYLVPRFLLNDFARYWRTIAVDFAYKRKTRLGKGAALRALKLRMSRKLIYASGLLACFGCELGLTRPRCRPPRRPLECVECLRELMAKTPLDILALGFLAAPHLDATARDVFAAYDAFIAMLANEEERAYLDALAPDMTWTDDRYRRAHQPTRAFQTGLIALFFDDRSRLGELTRHYGLF
jgi:predicted nucleotidyltransferase